MTHDLFYSEKENILFYVAGYIDNFNDVDKIIEMLQDHKAEFIKLGGEGKIYTKEITKSSRYKYMRVFWCKTKKIPVNAFKLGKDWDMWKWISN